MRRRVLITGAGSGLGLALGMRYAGSGALVACVDIDGERAHAACADLPGQGHLAFAADVGDDAAMQRLRDDVVAIWGGVDVLLNNAGIAAIGPLLQASMEEWQRVLNIDLLGVVRGCRLFLPVMLAQGQGQILNTASFAGLAGAPGIMSYGVAKAGVVALSEQLRAELHGTGVSVAVICPAFFQTRLIDTAIGSEPMKALARELMAGSPDSLDSVADKVFAAAERGQFLILPTRDEPMRWWIKRWFPQFYFRRLLREARRLQGEP